MRTLLGIISGLFLLPLLASAVFGALFVHGWEGGHGGGGNAGYVFLASVFLAYLLYCFACSIFGITGRVLYVSGIVAHLLLAVFIVGFSLARTTGPDDHFVGLGASLFLALVRFGYYSSVFTSPPGT